MKPKRSSLFLLAAATIVFTSSAHAATVTKATAGTDLAAAASWDIGVPITGDIATWTGTTSLGGTLALNQTDTTTQTWSAIEVQNASADIVIGTTSLGNATAFASGVTQITVVNAAGLSLGSIISGTGIAAGTTVTAIAGNTITLSTATTGANTGSAISVTPSPLNLTGNQTVQGVANTGIYLAAAGKNLTINQSLALGGPQTWFLGAGRTLRLNGVGTGSNALTLSGTGTMVVGNSAAFGTGDIAVTDSLKITNEVGFANNISIATGKILTLGPTSFVFNAVTGVISGDGALTVNNNVRLTGNNTFTGDFRATGGFATITKDAALGASTNTVTFAGATLSTYNAGAAVNLTRNIVLSSNTSVDINGQDLTLGGIISGSGGLGIVTTNSAKVVTLSGPNTYTGVTSFAGSTLSINSIKNVNGGASALGAVTTIANGTIGINNTTLKYTGTGDTTDRVINLPGTTNGATIDQSGASGLLKFTSNFTATGVGSKTLTLTGSNVGTGEISGAIVNNTTTGSTKLAANVAADALTITLASVDGLAAGQTITIGAATRTIASINTGTKVVTLTAGTSPAATAGANITSAGLVNLTSVTKSGTGTWMLSGDNTYAGITTVSAGTLNLANTNALQNSTLTTGGIVFDSSVASNAFTFGGLSGSSTIALQNNAGSPAAIALSVGNNNASTTYSGVISGTGSLTKVGTGTLTLGGVSSSTYTGGTTINGGTVIVANGNGPSALGTGAVTMNNGGTLNVAGWGISNSITLSGGTLTNSDPNWGGSVAGTNLSSGTASIISTTGRALNLSGMVRQVGATVNFTNATPYSITTTTGTASTVLTDAASGGAYATFGGTDWAAKTTGTGNTAVVGLSTIAGGYTAFASAGSVNLAGNANLTAGAADTYTLGADSATTTVRNITAAHNIDLGGFTLTTRGILSNQTSAISGTGSLQAAVSGGELVFHQTAGTTTVSSNIANNGTGTSLTKAGAGTLVLSGANTYTGNTTVNGGTISFATASLADASTVSIASGATLDLTHGTTDNIVGLVVNGVTQANGLYKSATGVGAGTVLASLTGNGKLLVAPVNTFATWMGSYNFSAFPGANLTPNGDADGDGITNLLEEIFGTAPNAATTGLTQTGATASSLTFKHPVNASLAADVTYSYQWSSDLAEWKASDQPNIGGTTATITAGAPVSGEVTVTTTISSGPAAKLFVRIIANQAP